MPSIPVQAEGFAYGGEAFGHLPDGRICFFRGGVPGETAEVEIVFSKRSFARGRLCRVLEASSARIVPKCPLATRPGEGVFCPGCSFQQVDYAVELGWKQRQLEDFLLRGRLADVSAFAPPVASPSRFGWRNRLKLTRRGGRVGFFADDNESIVPVEHCPLAVAPLDAALPGCRNARDDGEIFLRWTESDGVVVNGGARELTERLEGFGDFNVSADSFFQTNPQVAARLVRGVVDELTAVGSHHFLELYCGVGVFSLAAAETLSALHASGVESDPRAIGCARRNADRRHVADRCRFVVGNAEKWRELPKGEPVDTVLVDPPRRGLSARLIEALVRWRVPHLFYVSCAPDTLTRDLKRLAGAYRVVKCRMYDMFPCTAHFETLVRLDLQ